MNRSLAYSRRDSGSGSRKSFSAAAAALAAALLALGSSDLLAANGSWQPNSADQGVSVSITSDGSSWTVSPSLVEGDAVFIGTTTGVGLGTNNSYYYAVGVGATPVSPVGSTATYVRFSQSPSANTFNANGTNSPLTVTKLSSWFNTGNWAGGIVPNGIDDQASIVTNSTMTGILLDRDLTLGTLTVDTSSVGSDSPATVVGANGLSLISTSRTAGLLSTLTLKRSTGTPTITLTGGNSLSLSESKIVGTTPGTASARLVVVGDQGLVIDNQNTVSTPVAVNSTGVSSTPTYGVGPFRFGFGVDWSNFSGDLTLSRGVFQTLAGGSLGNNLSSLPMQSKLVLGTGSDPTRLEIPGTNGQTIVRGLSSTSSTSSIINSAILTTPASGGIALATFEVGSYGLASDSFTYAGNIGDTTNVGTLASSPAVRLVKVGPGTQILSGVNNMNATTTNAVLVAVNGGKLSLGTTGAIGTITGGQGAANADSSILLKNGEFELSGLGVAGARSQAFGGTLIFGSITPATSGPDVNQSSQSNSFSTLTVIADPAQPATLTFGSYKPRNFKSGDHQNLNGTTMLYRGTNLGATPGAGVASIMVTTAPTLGNNLFAVGSGTLGTPEASVLKGALADTSPTGHGLGFATYDPATGVRLLSAGEQQTVTSGSAYTSAPTNNNLLFTLAADEAITGHLSNTLQVQNTSGASRTVTNTGTDLNAANGMLFSGTDPIVLTGGQITGTTSNDGEDVVIHSINSSATGVTLQTPITNMTGAGALRQGWITYSGTGNFRLEGAQTVGLAGANTATSSFGGIAFNSTGTTTVAAPIVNATTLAINQGVVKLAPGASWTNTPRLFLAPEGKFDLNGVGGTATTNRFTDITGSINASGLTLTPGIGEVTNSSATTADIWLSTTSNGGTNAPVFVPITGNLNLVIDKSSFNSSTSTFTYGTQSMAGVSTYTGETRILSGVLNVARGGKLPATTVVRLGNTTGNVDTNGRDVIGTLSLGDSNTNGAARQTIAGLYSVGTGWSTVINNGSAVSQLTLNIPTGVDDKYDGNLGISITAPAAPATATPLGNAANLLSLRKIGPGAFEAAGSNYYTGGTIVQEGVLRVSADAKLGQIGSLSGVAGSSGAPVAPLSPFPNNIVLDGGTLQVTTTTDFVLDTKRGIGLGPVSGSTGGTGTLWVNSGINLTYGGVIASAGNTGTQTLVKNGTGLLLLNGANTFTGVTQVVAGSLGGVGSLASSVTVASGAEIAPGNGGIGTFTINGALTLNAGAVLNMELGAPGTSDKIQLGGGAVSATGTTTINLTGLAGFGVGTYTLISGASSLSAGNFVVGSVPSGYNGTLSASGGALTVTIAVGSPLSPIETWRQSHFGTTANSGSAADTADPDGDGLPNLVEYATGTDPQSFGASALSLGRSGSFLTLTYTRIADTSLTYTVEGSSDLSGAWTAVSAAGNPSTGVQNTAGSVTITDTVSVDAPGRRFLRLKVAH